MRSSKSRDTVSPSKRRTNRNSDLPTPYNRFPGRPTKPPRAEGRIADVGGRRRIGQGAQHLCAGAGGISFRVMTERRDLAARGKLTPTKRDPIPTNRTQAEVLLHFKFDAAHRWDRLQERRGCRACKYPPNSERAEIQASSNLESAAIFGADSLCHSTN